MSFTKKLFVSLKYLKKLSGHWTHLKVFSYWIHLKALIEYTWIFQNVFNEVKAFWKLVQINWSFQLNIQSSLQSILVKFFIPFIIELSLYSQIISAPLSCLTMKPGEAFHERWWWSFDWTFTATHINYFKINRKMLRTILEKKTKMNEPDGWADGCKKNPMEVWWEDLSESFLHFVSFSFLVKTIFFCGGALWTWAKTNKNVFLACKLGWTSKRVGEMFKGF